MSEEEAGGDAAEVGTLCQGRPQCQAGLLFSAVTEGLYMCKHPTGLWEFTVRAAGNHGWVLSKPRNDAKLRGRKNC